MILTCVINTVLYIAYDALDALLRIAFAFILDFALVHFSFLFSYLNGCRKTNGKIIIYQNL